jgi:hypothetical protein
MPSNRLALYILTVVAVITLAACQDSTNSAPTLVAPNGPSLAKGGGGGGGGGSKPHVNSTAASITMTPTSLALAVGGSDSLHVTLYDKNGNALPADDGSLLWYGCKPQDPALDTCIGYLNVAPVYPNLRDAYVTATGTGTFIVWVDDGNGHRAQASVTVQ